MTTLYVPCSKINITWNGRWKVSVQRYTEACCLISCVLWPQSQSVSAIHKELVP